MGQAPMSFFAPKPALAVGRGPLAASQELKHVIKELHMQGIEVILQVGPKMLTYACKHHCLLLTVRTCQKRALYAWLLPAV